MEFCPNCGQPIDPVTGRCPVCSGRSDYLTQKFQPGFVAALRQYMNSPLLLALAVLQSVYAVLIMLFRSSFSFTDVANYYIPIIDILFAVGLWMVWSAVRSDREEMRLGGIKMINVLITIGRVIFWIIAGVLIVVGLLFLISPSLLGDELIEMFSEAGADTLIGEFVGIDLDGKAIVLGFGVLVMLLGVIVILLNIFLGGSLSKSVKSLIVSFESDQNMLEKFIKVRKWLFIIGVIELFASAYSTAYDGMPANGVWLLLPDLVFTAICLVGGIYAGHIAHLTKSEY